MSATTLRYVMLSQILLMTLIIVFIVLFGDTSNKYLRMGPSNDLYILTVRIHNESRYIGILMFIFSINIIKTINFETAMPILKFNIYNPDKKVITEYGKEELYIYGNIIYLCNALIKNVLLILLSISQIDIALWSVITSEITSMVISRKLLNDKDFSKDKDEELSLV